MKQERYLIADGNTTLLIEGSAPEKRIELAQNAIESDYAEQVGFVTYGALPELEMMGDELCVNGTIAFASTLEREGTLKASGMEGVVDYRNNSSGLTEITFNLPYKRDTYKKEGDVILFDGIGYLYAGANETMAEESVLWELSKRYNRPAFGLARVSMAEYLPRLEPLVYVDKIGSCVVETACGSGSIAVNIVTGAREIAQRTGGIISVSRYNGGFTVSAEVAKIGGK